MAKEYEITTTSSTPTDTPPLTFRALGGADEVGASSYLYELGACRLLVDAGIRPKAAGAGSLPDLGALADNPPDAIVLTHAHLDHVGALPLVRRSFPGVPIYASAPTARIAELVMADTARVARDQDAPLYNEQEAAQTARQISVMEVGQSLQLPHGASVSPLQAGHIPGAVSLLLKDGTGRTVFHTGDLSNAKTMTVEAAHSQPSPAPVDAVVSESTYGDVILPSRKEQVRMLTDTIRDVIQSGGRALIPTFALGRAQEILLIILAHQRSAVLPQFPVYLDGLVRPITRLYDELLEAGDMMPKALANMLANSRRSPFFGEGDVRPVASADHRRQIIDGAEPAVILASSGMLHAGPSVAYARRVLTEADSALLTVGFQDEESPGRRLRDLSAGDSLPLPSGPDGATSDIPVGCRLGRYHLSAHADRVGLLNVLSEYPSPRVVLVHGEGSAKLALYEALHKDREVVQAANGAVVDLARPPRFGKPPATATGATHPVGGTPPLQRGEGDGSSDVEDQDVPQQTRSDDSQTGGAPQKLTTFNTHADVWVEDGMILLRLPEDVDAEHLFPEGRYRLKLRGTATGASHNFRAELRPHKAPATESADG